MHQQGSCNSKISWCVSHIFIELTLLSPCAVACNLVWVQQLCVVPCAVSTASALYARHIAVLGLGALLGPYLGVAQVQAAKGASA